jgi:hypothetical protein
VSLSNIWLAIRPHQARGPDLLRDAAIPIVWLYVKDCDRFNPTNNNINNAGSLAANDIEPIPPIHISTGERSGRSNVFNREPGSKHAAEISVISQGQASALYLVDNA